MTKKQIFTDLPVMFREWEGEAPAEQRPLCHARLGGSLALPATLLARALVVAALALTTAVSAQAQDSRADDERISFMQMKGTVPVHIEGDLFTRLNYTHQGGKPFLFPIIGPTGASMTRSFPMVEGIDGESKDHPHHRGLWFAHGNISGIDYWHSGGENGHTHVRDLPDFQGDSILIRARMLPEGNVDQPQATMLTQLDFSIDHRSDRIIDYGIHFPGEGHEQALTFGDTKEGTMAIRLHPALRLKGDIATGHCINSEGDTDGDCWGKRAKWVAYWGVIDGQTCGVAVFDHPTNLRHPTWWHARDYGLVAANPFGVSDFENRRPRGDGDYTLEADQTLTLHYRFVFFAGTAEEADIAGKYDAWVEETAADEPQEDEEK